MNCVDLRILAHMCGIHFITVWALGVSNDIEIFLFDGEGIIFYSGVVLVLTVL